MSSLARVVLVLVGIVAGGDSEALHVRISANRWAVAGNSLDAREMKVQN